MAPIPPPKIAAALARALAKSDGPSRLEPSEHGELLLVAMRFRGQVFRFDPIGIVLLEVIIVRFFGHGGLSREAASAVAEVLADDRSCVSRLDDLRVEISR